MSTKRYKAEQIVTVLRQIEVKIANGKTTPQACREAQITAQTYYLPAAGRSLAEGIRRTEVEPGETAAGVGAGERPTKRVVAELSLEKQVLQDVAEGNF